MVLPPPPDIISTQTIGLFESGKSTDDVEICLPELTFLPDISEKHRSLGFGDLIEQ